MIDIKDVRDRLNDYREAAKNKNIILDFDKLLKLDDKRKEFQNEIDKLRTKRNELAKSIQSEPSDEQIKKGKDLKTRIYELEEDLRAVIVSFEDLMVEVPTIPSKDTPIGRNEEENVEIESWGNKPVFDFNPKDYMEIAKELDIIDFDRGVKVSGYRGYYMKNEGALLQMALMMFALDKLVLKGFTPIIPPTLVREFVLFGSGYFAGKNYDSSVDEIYKIENQEKDADGKEKREGKFLIGTAEPSLLAYYSGEVLDEKKLPLKLCGFSQCYRSEIGSYGKDTKGIYRVHEFMKVEQVCICPADVELADKMHREMVEISKELHQELGLPYRVLQICTGDMSAGKYKMFDLEAWIPSRDGYGETGSASNFLDWQSRRLNVKYQKSTGKKEFVYMLNNTALASTRPIIAILENFQQADGSVSIPKVLQKFIPGGITKIQVKNKK